VIDVGTGSAVVLLHGFPHTYRLWDLVAPRLAQTYRVVAPDLVAGGSALELADRVEGVLDDLGIEHATMIGIDAGVAAAIGFALAYPARTRRLAVMEMVLPGIAGAEAFTQNGLPWWFGFHQVHGLAERVLAGHEREYIEWFLRAGTVSGEGIGSELTDAFVASYRGESALAGAFEHYRARPRTAEELAELLPTQGLKVPVLAIGSHPVGQALATQLDPFADDLTSIQLDDCGHLIPLDAPDRLLAALLPWLDAERSTAGEDE
jgi:pimeloyl-ACP methyl ester carboxylesterase